MNYVCRAFFALVALLAASTAHAVDAEPLFGTWAVTSVYCRVCKSVGREDVGTMLVVTPDSIDSPLIGGACPKRVGFRDGDLPPQARRSLLHKLDPAWLDAKRPAPLIIVTCDGLDFALLFVLPHDTLALVADGSTAYRFSKRAVH
jgi:hypothetical protein